MKHASGLRQNLSPMDYDPGYFCKFVKDQFVRHTIKENKLRSILDVGCDTGYIAGLLNYDKYEFSYMGIDARFNINPAYFKENNQSFCKIYDTPAYLKQLETGRFDCILLLDVIEHFKNHKEGLEVLEVCADKLPSGGFLFVSTPNQLGEKPNWPEYHQYEYKLEDLLLFDLSRKDLQCFTYFGWSMSDDVFDKIVKRHGASEYFCDLFPKSISRVFGAIGNPNYARDVIFVWQKKNNS